MAGFHTKTFTKHDDYMTPKHAWEAIERYIPRNKQIWEAFYGNGDSGNYLKEMGFSSRYALCGKAMRELIKHFLKTKIVYLLGQIIRKFRLTAQVGNSLESL